MQNLSNFVEKEWCNMSNPDNKNLSFLNRKTERYIANEAMDYIDIVNHQLREPVSNIFASLPLLAENINSQNTEESIKTLQAVYQKSYQMLKSVNNMTLGTKLMAGREFSVSAVDFSSLVKSVFESANLVLPDYCKIESDITDGCIINGNVSLLTAMLFNLLLNSFDYRKDENINISVKLKLSGNRCVFTYRDNSIGIKPELASKVFEPCFSVNPYNDGEQSEKMGLGLYVAKCAAENAGGTLLLGTEFSEGVSIVVSLPERDMSDGTVVKSSVKDFILNKYSDMYVMLCEYCNLPDLT